MNKFKEFDWIQTPNDWKEESLTQPYKKRCFYTHRLAAVGIVFVICFSSLGLVYAYNETFRLWIQEQFQSENIKPVPELVTEKLWCVEDLFLYYYHEIDNEEVIDSVYVFKDGKYEQQEIMHMEGQYLDQSYSFDYVRYLDRIFTFNEKGYIVYTVSYLNQDLMYFGSGDTNLCSLNLKDQTIKKLTSDNQSVNFSISPNKTYILINKKDKYWTFYNTKTYEEKKLDDLNAYAHDNEYHFLNDYQLITYDNHDMTCVINLKTLKTKHLNVQCIYPEASTFLVNFNNNKTIITDVFINKKEVINFNLSSYNYGVRDNRYIIFNSFDEKKIVLYDFKQDKIIELDYVGTEQEIDYIIIENKYLIITNSQEYYIISFSELFHE